MRTNIGNVFVSEQPYNKFYRFSAALVLRPLHTRLFDLFEIDSFQCLCLIYLVVKNVFHVVM